MASHQFVAITISIRPLGCARTLLPSVCTTTTGGDIGPVPLCPTIELVRAGLCRGKRKWLHWWCHWWRRRWYRRGRWWRCSFVHNLSESSRNPTRHPHWVCRRLWVCLSLCVAVYVCKVYRALVQWCGALVLIEWKGVYRVFIWSYTWSYFYQRYELRALINLMNFLVAKYLFLELMEVILLWNIELRPKKTGMVIE